jgi:small subunit ribosomal protein S18
MRRGKETREKDRDRDRDRDRDQEGGRGDRRGGGGGQRRGRRFTELKLWEIDYRNERLLRKFVSDRGKILPRRITGISAFYQRCVTRAVKRARHLALLPFVAESYK